MKQQDVALKYVNLPIPGALHAQLVELAAQQGRSLRKQIVWMLERQMEPPERQKEQSR